MKRQEIERLLPEIFRRTCIRGTLLFALLETMAGLHAPSEQIVEEIDMIVDPLRTRDAFVASLARWVDLERIFDPYLTSPAETPEVPISTGLGRLRELTAAAGKLAQWRGTRRGLISFLTTATGVDGFEIVEGITEDGQVRPFHIEVIAPESTRVHGPLLNRIIQQEKPAYATYRLRFR